MSDKYKFNYNYFNVIDNEEKAYWLGFLYADGYNNRKKRTISLSLAEEDLEHLYLFSKCIDVNKPIYLSNKNNKCENCQNMYRLDITNENFSQKLVELGCFQAKTFILKFPTQKQVPKNLIRHFIRGYFDGDGSVWFTLNNKRKHVRPTFSIDIVGTEQMIFAISKILKGISVNSTIYRPHKERNNNICQLIFGGNITVQKFLDYLYKDSGIYLSRKYKKYLQLIELNRIASQKRVKQINVNTGEIVKIWNNSHEISDYYHVHNCNLTNVLNKHKIKQNGKEYIRKTYRGYRWEYCDKETWDHIFN